MTSQRFLSLGLCIAVACIVPGMSASLPSVGSTATTGAVANGILPDVMSHLLERFQREAGDGKLPDTIAQLLNLLQDTTRGGIRNGLTKAGAAADGESLPDLLKQLADRVQAVLHEAAADERYPLTHDDKLAEMLADLLYRLTACDLPDLISQVLQLTTDDKLAALKKDDAAAHNAKLAKLMVQLLDRLQERQDVFYRRAPSAGDARLLELLSQLLDRLHDVAHQQEETGGEASNVDVSQLTRVVDAMLTWAADQKRAAAGSAGGVSSTQLARVVHPDVQQAAVRRLARRMHSS